MLGLFLGLAAAQSAALISAPPVDALPPAPATAASPRKPKMKCETNNEPAVGSHIFMDSCHSEKVDPGQGFRDYHAYVTELRTDKGIPPR